MMHLQKSFGFKDAAEAASTFESRCGRDASDLAF